MPARPQRASASLPVTPALPQVDERQVGVGAARDRAQPLGREPVGQRLAVGDHLAGVALVRRLQRLLQRHRLRRDRVHERAALAEREHRLVDALGQLLLADDHAAARAAQDLVGREGHDVGVGHRAGDRLAGDQADEVGGVDEQPGADLVGDGAEGLEVDQPGIRRGAADDHLGAVLPGQRADLVVVDELVGLADAVGHDVEPLAGEVDLAAVGEVAAVRQAHGEHRVTGLEQRGVDREVGGGAGVRLQVGVVARRRAPSPGRCRSALPGRRPRSRRSSDGRDSPRRTCWTASSRAPPAPPAR